MQTPMPMNRYQPQVEPGMGQAAPMDAEPQMGSMSAPGLPQAARQQTSMPQPPGQPFARQNMPQQAQMQRRMAPPNVS